MLTIFSNFSVQKQYHNLLFENVLPAPTAFFLKEMYEEVNGFDEEIRMMEDWPFWIKCTKDKRKVHFLDEYTVNYRVSENSVSHSLSFYKIQQKVKEKYCYPNIAWYNIGYYYHEKILSWKSRKLDGLMQGTMKCKGIKLMYAILWPPRLIEILKYR